MSFTPGPLRLVPPGGPQGPFWGLISEDGYVVATQIVGLDNAGLFQAAPDLYAAAEHVLEELHKIRAQDWPVADELRAAIAKAKGVKA